MQRWSFWVLAPPMLATALALPLLPAPDAKAELVTWAFSAVLVLAALGLAWPQRQRWALRAVAGAVLLAYLAYAASELAAWRRGEPFGAGGPRSRANLYNALRGLAAFGLPALCFLIRGRSGTAVDELLEDPPADGASGA